MSVKANQKVDDCWNRIGVWGSIENRCARLQQVIHCRNCDVFEQAARSVLENKLPAGYKQLWTSVFHPIQGGIDGEQISGIVFRVRSEWFLLDSACFDKVACLRPIHAIPHKKGGYLKGFVNIDGEVRLCFSLAALLGVPEENKDVSPGRAKVFQRFIVTKIGNEEYVFLVDEIKGLERFGKNTLIDAPLAYSDALQKAVTASVEAEFGMINVLNQHALHQMIQSDW